MKYLKGTAVFAFLMIGAWLSSLPWECKIPEPNSKTEQTASHDQYHCQSLSNIPIILLEVVDRKDKAIVALSTLIIAIFTIVLGVSTVNLWNVTEAAAKAAKLSADAAINSERPFVYVSDLELVPIEVAPQPDGVESGEYYQMAFVFTNYGKSPAFVKRIGYGFAVGTEPPPIPEYRFVDDLTVEVVIRPDRPFRFDVPYVVLAVKPEQKKAFAEGSVFPWLWGQIQFEDFMNGIGETGFIAFRYPEIKAGGRLIEGTAFRFRGPAGYTYQRYTQSKKTET